MLDEPPSPSGAPRGSAPDASFVSDGDRLSDALSRCAAGDRDALRLIFESEGGRLVTLAERILKRRDLAEEVVQDAFLQIFAKAHQYAPDRGSARGWIFAIVRNRSLNALRHGRWEEPLEASEIEALRDGEVTDEALGAWSRLEASSRLRECLAMLDDAKRRSILMAYVSGYTHGEIAGRLRVPLGTAKAWVRRGLSALRDCMT